MKKLDVEESVVAIFALCAEVALVRVRGTLYYYFDAQDPKYLQIVRYILKRNGVKSDIHKTHYYNNYSLRSVVRVSADDLSAKSAQEFKPCFEKWYACKSNLSQVVLVQQEQPKVFKLWPRYKKFAFIDKVVDKVR